MNDALHRVDLGAPLLLEFRGPDAVRFLNGQLTQDVRRVAGSAISHSSCVTDAKGRLQFRIDLTSTDDGALWVSGLAEWAERLEARLTRYLIADDVEVTELTGEFTLTHFTGPVSQPPPGVVARESSRFGVKGTDWWIPSGSGCLFPAEAALLSGDALEALRISSGIPAWGSELAEGILPPEAGLEVSDISYQKGCYIGQEVISRIKSAGKVNKLLTHFIIPAGLAATPGPLVTSDGRVAGELTSISPLASGVVRHALGFAKRGAEAFFIKAADGTFHAIERLPPV